jgi:hypothetical protein
MKIKLLFAIGLISSFNWMGQASTKPGYTAHEWGTFTSIQGSDGVPLTWNPFTKTDLPVFVYELNQPLKNSGTQIRANLQKWIGAKSASMWLQRMETPVIYFYPDAPMTVDVQVDFPQGQITEWYPQVTKFGPTDGSSGLWPRNSKSLVRWQQLHLLGAARGDGIPPVEESNHYFDARTESASLVKTGVTIHPKEKTEMEKFLFYRGVGNFATPLRLYYNDLNNLVLENSTKEPLRSLFILKVEAGKAELRRIPQLDFKPLSGEQLGIPFHGSVQEVSTQLSAAMELALVAEGLFDQEAAAMVKTWKNSWFAEEGVRVLYLLPRQWTDQTLPLQLDPKPRELVRVMVGRSEVFSPKIESRFRELFSKALDPKFRGEAIAEMRSLPVGRFLEPALTRLTHLEMMEAKRKIASISRDIQQPSLLTLKPGSRAISP